MTRDPFCKDCGNQGEKARLADLGDGTFVCRNKGTCEHRVMVERAKLARLNDALGETERLDEATCSNCGSTEPHMRFGMDEEGNVVSQEWHTGLRGDEAFHVGHRLHEAIVNQYRHSWSAEWGRPTPPESILSFFGFAVAPDPSAPPTIEVPKPGEHEFIPEGWTIAPFHNRPQEDTA